MRILLTGGMGEIGRPTAQILLSHGHEVRILDLRVATPVPGAECIAGDVTDIEVLRRAARGMEGIIHLAAYRHPGLAPSYELFRVNCGGTFNVFTAAAEAGIRRVVCASSINALGYNFGVKFPEGQLRYFPIDEAHPTYTTDAYSFSKKTIEEIGTYFWRREGIVSAFLRFPAVYDLAVPDSILLPFVMACEEQTAAVLGLPEPHRSERVQEIISSFQRKAAAHEWEDGFNLMFPDAFVMFGRSNFWTSLDVRDAAQAAEKALTADYNGSQSVYVTDDHNFVGMPTRELARVFFPEVTAWRKPVAGTETLVSIDAAKSLFGFSPAYPLRKA